MEGGGVNEGTVDLNFISLLLLSRGINMKYGCFTLTLSQGLGISCYECGPWI